MLFLFVRIFYYLCNKRLNLGKSNIKLLMESILNELRRIADLTPADLTPADKAFIKEQAKAAGIEFNPRSACKSCYIDCAVLIYRRLTDAENAAQVATADTTTSGRLWVLKEGVDVVWRGIRINAATITDEKAVQYLKSGFPRKFFV